VIPVISKIKYITELNQQFIKTGFFVVKNVGMQFLNIIIIPTVAQESPNNDFNRKLIYKKQSNIKKLGNL
jgi:hypothetical protein